MRKTNAVRLAQAAGIALETREYDVSDEDYDGTHAAQKLGLDPALVFKTLVMRGDKTGPIVCCLPVAQELDLKKAARASGNKSVEMLHVKELLPLTGYVRGGCSPIGMKKQFPTYIDETAQLFDQIAVSAGMRGEQMLLAPGDLCALIGAEFCDITL